MVVVDHHEYLCEEEKRLKEDRERTKYWKKWGPYVAERQWATVREDYSENGDAWSHFSHDQARSRAYRWGEDGIAGVSDSHGMQNVAFAFWNEKDDFLKERLFGLSNPQGNHGESIKEAHFHVDNTPTHCKSCQVPSPPNTANLSHSIHEIPLQTSSKKVPLRTVGRRKC
jgi:hypothetical protein